MMTIWVLNRIVKIAPNQVLIITGRSRYFRTPDGRRFRVGFRMVKGGRTFVWPFIERVDLLSLEIIPIDFISAEIITPTGDRYVVDAAIQARIGSDDVSIATAAQNLLSKTPDEIVFIVKQVVEGHLRRILGSSTDKHLASDWNSLSEQVRDSSEPDLNKLGMELVTFIVRNITCSG
jgi:flotillin